MVDDSYSVSRYLRLASRCKAFRAKVHKLERELINMQNDKGNESVSAAPSSEEDYDLTLMAMLDSMDGDTMSKLFPELPKDYFKNKTELWKRRNPSLIDRYESAKVRPYVKIRNFNAQGGDGSEDVKSHNGYEAGVEVKF